jgi:hypothetical protein
MEVEMRTRPAQYGFRTTKIAAENESDAKTIDPALLAGGAAGLTPFLGLIGEKKLIHDPTTNSAIRRMSRIELEQLAKPGDILVTSKGGPNWYKTPQEAFTGSPFYHVEPVVEIRGGRGRTMDAGHIWGMGGPKRTRSLKDMLNYTRTFSPHEDMVLLRPNTPIAPKEMNKYLQDITAGGSHKYQKSNAITAWLHDVFAPKLPRNSKAKYVCKGGVCSTVPGQALQNLGRSVIPGASGRQVMPADFLRSTNYTPIGASITNPATAGLGRRIMPYAARAGLGALLAAGAYGGTKYLLNRRKNNDQLEKNSSAPATNSYGDLGTYRFNHMAQGDSIAEGLMEILKAHDRRPGPTHNESGVGITFQEGITG